MEIIGDNGLSLVKGALYPGFQTPEAPKGAVLIGTDAAGNNWCYVQRLQNVQTVVSNANTTDSPQTIKYSISTGSTIGFSQKFGVTVEVSASISFVVSYSAKVQFNTEIGFSQAFSSLKTIELTVQCTPGVKTTIYQGTIAMDYYKLANIWTGQQSFCTQEWQLKSSDVIETSAYETAQSPLPTKAELEAMV